MQTQNPFFDDMARMMSGAMGVASGMREEMEQRLRQMMENATSRMDLVSREEFEAVKAMAVKAREENEALAKRVAELESALKAKPAARSAPKKTAAKSSTKSGATRSRKASTAKTAGSTGSGSGGSGPANEA